MTQPQDQDGARNVEARSRATAAECIQERNR